MTRKLIAFALSFVLTLCGIATAQNQQSWGSMALMRAGVGTPSPWVNPDPNADSLVFWLSFDNLVPTNAAGMYFDDGPYDMHTGFMDPAAIRHRGSYTNSSGLVDYALVNIGFGNGSNVFTNKAPWAKAVSEKPFSANGLTLQIARRGVQAGYPFLFYINTKSDDGAITNTVGIGTQNGPFYFLVSNGGVNQVALQAGSYTATGEVIVTMSYASNNCVGYVNGIRVGADTSCTAFPYSNLVYLQWGMANVNERDIRIYSKALSSQEVYNAAVAMNATNNLWAKPTYVIP
jgi:hypothetical protein